ncbi:hypothetical protein V2G26_015785 [Clonostachys chloroleuca]
MVCIKQVSIPAVVLLSLAEQAVAAPVALRGDIAVRDAAQTADAIELAIRELELDERGLGKFVKGVAGKVISTVKKNPGKTLDRGLSTANTAMTVANTHKAVSGKRDVEELDERDLEELDERDIEEEVLLALRDLDLHERGLLKKVLTPFVQATKVVQKNPGKTFDRLLSTGNTAMAVANTHKTQTGKRDVEELDERDLEELDERDIEEEVLLALRDLDLHERGLLKKVLTPFVQATKVVQKNPGKTFDRLLSTGNTAMAVANTHKTQTGKRDIEELDQRDIEEEIILALRDLDLELDERSILNIAKKVGGGIVKGVKAVGTMIKKNPGKAFDRGLSTANTAMTVANTNKALKGKRDLDEIEERDWEDIEERDVEELEERDWEDIEERGVGTVLKKVAKGAFGAMDIISKNQGKSYNRANAAANSAMKVAQTKKKQEKRDFAERDFEYLNSLSQRDLEDLELVVRALYGDYLEDY